MADIDARADGYRELLDTIPGGVAVVHVENGIFFLDYANEGWFDAHHVSKEYGQRFMGSGIIDIVYPSDRATVAAQLPTAESSDMARGSATIRVIGEDGALHWIDLQYRYAYTEHDHRYYHVSYSDYDEPKQVEDELEESQSALKEAISNSDIQFFTYFPDEHRCENHMLNDRLEGLPTSWSDFPDSFLEYTKVSPEDARAYRKMIAAVDGGAESAECTVRFTLHGIFIWERIRVKSIRDRDGRITKVQGYSINVTAHKDAEERIRKERLRLKALEGNVFEAFSFNVTKNSQPDIETSDKKMLELPIPDEVRKQALRVSPPLGSANAATREVLLHAASRIPDSTEREQFITTCSGKAMIDAISSGRYNAEVRYRRYVGDSIRWVSTVVEILPDPESGDLVAFFYTRDISEEVINEELAKRLIESNYVAVSYIDLQSKMFRVNAAKNDNVVMHRDTPYREAIDSLVDLSVSPADAEECKEKFALETIVAKLTENPVYTFYYAKAERANDLPGKPFVQLKNDAFYLDDHRDIIVLLSSDVTEIFEQERENREKMAAALAAAEQASIAKTEFLSRMSHEIRTPMNAIIGLDAIALQEEGISSTMIDHLQKIGISARFLLSLINDILDMSRIESGRMALRNEEFDFEELVNGINTILYEQCRDSGLDYECVLKSFTEQTYIGDATKLQQVLVNILGNAVKFTPEGGKVNFSIEQVSRSRGKARMRFEISDTGIGIDDKFLPHLFEPFSQENRGRTSAYGGSGLGLAISKNIVNLMNGDITVHSIKNVGSEFSVEVELGLSDKARHARPLAASGIRPLFTLVVDDDIIVCRHTKQILDEAGFNAEWIDSGAGAVEKVTDQHKQRKDYDLILLDWKMPDMDGIETAREIRKVVGPDVTIIIMTAYDWTDIEKRARAAGVDMFMRKPVFASSVTQAFENVFRIKGKSIEAEQAPSYDFSGKRILLAEDNEINAEIAKSILEMKGCTVDVAGNGAEAVESFAAANADYYDLVLMDVRMPVMDGLEATRTIRAMRKADSKTIPIVAMTANAFQEDVNQSLESGMSAHLAKPIEPQKLYETIDRFLKKQADKPEA